MTIENTVSIAICDPRSSIVQSVFDCRLSGVIKVIEIVLSFLDKALATIS